jgi:aminopeptidase N
MHHFIRSLGIAIVAAALTLAAAAQPRHDFDTAPGRLPKTVLPSRYALTLTLDPDSERFQGEVTVTLRARQAVDAIVLHARELSAVSTTLLTDGSERALIVQADEPAQLWRLRPADGGPIAAGEHRLRIAYQGRVQRSDSGLFQVPHTVAGKPARMLATQMEAVFARLVLPCFDEPAFRAVFELSVRAPAGWQVLANMPQQSESDDAGQVLHRFAPTPPMPSYLLAVAVGRFDALEGSADGVPLRILTAPGKRELGAWALGATQQILPFYNAYFGVPYALPKLDQVAVPGTREGAMEDWGLISYSEDALLFDPAKSGTQARRGIFTLLAHEVAHQWVGNWVTAASWEEIWLNEAFATWMAEKATERFHPEWQTALRRRQDIDRTMGRDAGPATRAIRSGAVPEDRVFDVFDDITYSKGGAVLSMLEQWLGAETFRHGMAAYMQERRLSNATAGDLWFHIGQAAGRDVAAVAASWTDQPGFPLVQVAARCDGGRTRLQLAQSRFSTAAGSAGGLWKIPVVVEHRGRRRTLMLEQAAQGFSLPGCSALPPLVNPGGEGFYRVAYAPALRAALARRFAQLPDAMRISLLSDSFALAQAGTLPLNAYLDLLTAVPQVRGPSRPALFAQARGGLAFLDEALQGHPAQAPLRAMARALLAPELRALGWTPQAGEDSEVEAQRSSLIRDLARFDDADTLRRARELFEADDEGRSRLPAATRSAVVRAVGEQADAELFARLLKRLLAAQDEDDRWLFANALAATRDAGQAAQVLALTLQGRLPTNIATRLPGMVGGSRWHAALAYRYAVDHWQALADLVGDMFGARAWLLPGPAGGFNDAAQARQLVADQKRLAGAPGAAAAAMVAARIELRAAVREREAQGLEAALAACTEQLQRRTAR